MTADGTTRGPVRIAWAHVAAGAVPDPVEIARLAPDQAARAAGMPPADATRFVRGRMLMARLAGEVAGRPPAVITSRCERCGGNHGRPAAVDAPAVVGVSYADGLVVAVAAPSAEVTALGVDVEAGDDPDRRLDDLAALFAPAPPPTLREWTLIEAAVKADGRGMRIPPAGVRLTGASRTRAVEVRLPGRAQPIQTVAVRGPAGHVVSLAVVARARSGS
ncbi:MAG: hypothetical protein QM626_01255 [Microbacterium sp.]|uniref:4'-phosphopantetheinyl transferase family protein n=1 Tax=Microbacterium sp. TaxID=51671 RepID=UPI0039E5239B